jgi:hypothetical protein
VAHWEAHLGLSKCALRLETKWSNLLHLPPVSTNRATPSQRGAMLHKCTSLQHC